MIEKKVRVETTISYELWKAVRESGLTFSAILEKGAQEAVSVKTKTERHQANQEQLGLYNDAISVIKNKLIQEHNGSLTAGDKTPAQLARVWAGMLLSVGYATTSQELLEDAKTAIKPRQKT